MKRVKIFDTTLRDGEQSPGCSMNLSEKIIIARQLEKLGVDIIEAGFAIASPMDFKSVQTIASSVSDITVASLARANKKDIDCAWDAVKNANHPRIHLFLATSDVHMQYKLRMTREQVLQTISEMTAYAKSKCADIEFSAEDASRSDREFLAKCFSNAIAAGATTINVPDTVGYSTPQEMGDLISYLMEHVEGIANVDVSVHCHNDLGMGVANSLACVKAGATQVECTVNGIGERAGNASLEEIVMAIRTRRDFYDADTILAIVWRPRQGEIFRFEFSNVNEAHRAMRNFSPPASSTWSSPPSSAPRPSRRWRKGAAFRGITETIIERF